MDKSQSVKMFILILKMIAILLMGWLGQSVALLCIAAIILLQIPERASLRRDVCEVLTMAAILLMTFLYPNISNTFYVVLLTLYTLIVLIKTEKTTSLALISTLVTQVGFCSIALNIVPIDIASSHILIWSLFIFGAIASSSEKSVMLFGVFVVTALILEIDNSLIAYAALGVFTIELMSSQKQKTLQVSVLLGLVVSPFHTWQLAALVLICLASQFQKSAGTLRSYAAILALFSCLIVASDLTPIVIIFLGLLYILNDKNRLGSLC